MVVKLIFTLNSVSKNCLRKDGVKKKNLCFGDVWKVHTRQLTGCEWAKK